MGHVGTFGGSRPRTLNSTVGLHLPRLLCASGFSGWGAGVPGVTPGHCTAGWEPKDCENWPLVLGRGTGWVLQRDP